MYFFTTLLIVVSLYYVLLRNRKFGIFTSEKTILLKAFLPFMIFIHHTYLFNNDFKLAGAFVCSVFFFKSGYGLETKRKRNAINITELATSVKKLLVPFVIPVVLFLTIRFFREPFSVVVEENILQYQIILPYTWFVLTLIILYSLYYMIASISLNRSNVIFYSLIVAAVFAFNILGFIWGVPAWGRYTTTGFLAGILYINIENGLIEKLNAYAKVSAVICSVLLFSVTAFVRENPIEWGEVQFLKMPLLAFTWAFLVMTLYSVIPPFENRIVKYLSSISFELYICQSIGFLLIGDKHQYHPVIFVLLVLVVCPIVASLCKLMTDAIFHRKHESINCR